MSPSQPLTVDDLEALKERWVKLGAPIATALNPGLSDDEIDATTAPLGITLPPELRTFWSWANPTFERGGDTWMSSSWQAYPLDVAVSGTRDTAAMYAETWSEVPPHVQAELDSGARLLWRPTWFQFTDSAGSGCLFVDAGEASPTSEIGSQDWEDSPRWTGATLGDAVRLWTRLIDVGYYIFEDGFWSCTGDDIEDFPVNHFLL